MKKFFSNSLIVSFFLLFSKILGFVRDLLLASFFGSSSGLQAFLIAFRFPEFIRKVTSSGALTQIVNPYLNGAINSRDKKFIVTILYFLAMLMLIVTLLAILFSGFWTDIYAYGFIDKNSSYKLVENMFVIMIPYILFNSIMGLIAAILNSYSRYLISSLLPIILNIIMIVGVIISPTFNVAIYSVAYSVLIAGIIQVIVGFYALHKLVGNLKINKDVFLLKDNRSRIFLKKFPGAFFGTAILQINGLIETFFASFLISGSLAWLYYADRVNQFLYGVFGTAIAVVVIPYLASYKSNKDRFIKILAWVMKLILLITIPAIIGLFILAKPIVITLFYYGHFNIRDVDFTYLAMLGYLLSLFCFVVVRVVVSALYTQNKTSEVFYVSLFCLMLSIILDILVVYFCANDEYAFMYLAFVNSSVALINLFIQLLVLSDFNTKIFVTTYLPFNVLFRVFVASLFMVFVLNLFNLNDSYWIALSMFGRLKNICLIISSGFLTYISVIIVLGTLKLLKVTDL
ncbi:MULTISPECIES: murein biosynthesis integral membrane protein MurJ [unclassified Francisella]|uniref:murein biosynthesis integral membrane protein MurJ n=1 Tax=unclassified Francisella TaxID=2610885 RepID=UPI002E325E36|nr:MULTISPECIES: murein biosynthesis integral membrane protein MurJ [unclassified Francisella]MED7820299.1 murein biosynthesis integral membrane protein MurJ [Francisella sp. 19S2-4]MED7831129.1 murein biosynthesis integral membrane protein MurJ [Francisella sp. 19S2-10]